MRRTLTDDGHATIPPTGGHARARRPDAGERVVPFHAAQARRTVETAAHVQQPVVGADAQTAPLRAQRRDRRPSVAVRVVALGRGQVHYAVVPAGVHKRQSKSGVCAGFHTGADWGGGREVEKTHKTDTSIIIQCITYYF